MALEYIQLLNDTKCSIFTEYTYPTVLWGDNYPNSDQKATFYAYFQTRNFNFWIDGEYTYDFGAFTLIHKVQSSNNNEWITVKRKSDNATLVSWNANNGGGRGNLESYISFAVDRDSELGYIFLGSCQTISYNSNKWQYYIGSGSLMSGGGTNDLYNVLLESSIPPNGGGAGSGYIGNSLLSNKKMVGYNVPTSSATGTKTESVNDVSASAVSDKPKSGNGFARIKFLRDFEPPEEYRQYLDTINGTGFFFRDWPQVHNDDWNIDYYPHYPLYIHSYKSYGGDADFNSGSPWIEETSKGIASLYITEQQTGWGYDTTFEAYDWVYWATTPNNRTQIGIINKTNQCILGRSGSSYGWDTDATHNRTDTTGHGYESLSALFYDITRLYRNVNIYVNGVLWSSALTQ